MLILATLTVLALAGAGHAFGQVHRADFDGDGRIDTAFAALRGREGRQSVLVVRLANGRYLRRPLRHAVPDDEGWRSCAHWCDVISTPRLGDDDRHSIAVMVENGLAEVVALFRVTGGHIAQVKTRVGGRTTRARFVVFGRLCCGAGLFCRGPLVISAGWGRVGRHWLVREELYRLHGSVLVRQGTRKRTVPYTRIPRPGRLCV